MSHAVEYLWVDSNTSLQACVDYLGGASELAVDTEFMRTDTFYPIPALLQLSDGQRIYLIDPLAISEWQPLRDLMLDSSVIKVLHSVSEDMEVFQRLLDCVPQPLLDTQIGAGLAGLGSGLGYQKLIDQLLGIAVEKGRPDPTGYSARFLKVSASMPRWMLNTCCPRFARYVRASKHWAV